MKGNDESNLLWLLDFKVERLFGGQATSTSTSCQGQGQGPDQGSEANMFLQFENSLAQSNGNQNDHQGHQILVDGMLIEDVANFELVDNSGGGINGHQQDQVLVQNHGQQELPNCPSLGGGNQPEKRVNYYSRKGN